MANLSQGEIQRGYPVTNLRARSLDEYILKPTVSRLTQEQPSKDEQQSTSALQPGALGFRLVVRQLEGYLALKIVLHPMRISESLVE